jgi:signal transduction histidine kinase
MLQGYVGDITEVQRDVLEKAFEGNERQIQIINQILSAARVDTGRLVVVPTPLDLRSLTQGIAAEMGPTLELRDHMFTLRVPAQPVYVSADLTYLRMAIENVVQNATIYTPKGGAIRMELNQVRGNAVLRISDTGVGIRKKDIGKLFVKFSRIHNPLSVEAGGSGIGLYLTAEIVRLHGGTIHVESRIGRGTTFAISLPLVHNKNTKMESAGSKAQRNMRTGLQ